MTWKNVWLLGVLGGAAGGGLAASDGDVGLLSASAPLPAGTALTAAAAHQWPDHPGIDHPAVSDGSAYAEASVIFGGGTSMLISLGGYELALDAGPESPQQEALPHHLSYEEFEILPRHFTRDGGCIGADLDLIYNNPRRGFSWDKFDGTVVLFAHPQATAVTSWMYELVYTSQPLYHLPELLPGVAYCLSYPTLKACLGLPFASLDWTPNRHWEISGQVANASTVALAHLTGSWQQSLIWTWNSHLLRLPIHGRGDFLIYDEMSVDVNVGVTHEWGNATVSVGRAFSRSMSDESRRQTQQLGAAWECSSQGELDF